MKPSDYPPPFDWSEFVVAPGEPEIEVGVLIVGAGPAGLACAIRLGQLLEGAPELAERLGDVPVAVLEKGRQPGSHLLSGAVVNPRSLRKLFDGRYHTRDLPFYGRVEHESVYFLTPQRYLRIPTPPTMKNGDNYVASLSQLGRWLAERAEEGGATILPETSGHALLVGDGRVRGVRTGDRGRGRDGQELANFEPGSDVHARVTVLAEGTQGHLTGVALDRFALQGDNPQVWALGVKEVWKIAKPLDRVIHTLGWPLRAGKKYREFGGSFVYPMGDDMLTVGMVVGLDYRDAELSVHDLLQELKTHPMLKELLWGGERVAWGAKTIPEGGFLSLPKRLHAPGLLICGDGAGLVNVPALKGIHYAVESGRLAAEAAFAALQRGESPGRRGALAGYDRALQESFVWSDLKQVRNMRPAFGRGLVLGGALAGAMTATRGAFPPGDSQMEPDADQELIRTDRAKSYPLPDGDLTFDKLSSVFLSGNATRDDAPNHIRVQREVPKEIAELWTRMCPAAGLRGGRERRRGDAVELRPVRRDHRQGRPPHSARGRRGAGLQADVIIELADVEAARERIAGRVHRTPTFGSETLSERAGGAEVHLKAELFQKTGSFKPRGALNKLSQLSDEEKARGVISISAGNHAQALAYASAQEGIDALVVMWQTASPLKIEAARGYGATIDTEAPDIPEAFERLEQLIEETGRTLVHPYDDPFVMAGQGTVGLELLEDVPEPDVVLVPVGGGGLVSGIATAVKGRSPKTRVVAVEPERSRALHESMKAGEPVTVEAASLADGLNGPYAGANCVQQCLALGVESVLVTEDELKDAFRFLYTRAKLAPEVAGAATTAALLARKAAVEPGQRVVAVVSGGNVATDTTVAILSGR